MYLLCYYQDSWGSDDCSVCGVFDTLEKLKEICAINETEVVSEDEAEEGDFYYKEVEINHARGFCDSREQFEKKILAREASKKKIEALYKETNELSRKLTQKFFDSEDGKKVIAFFNKKRTDGEWDNFANEMKNNKLLHFALESKRHGERCWGYPNEGNFMMIDTKPRCFYKDMEGGKDIRKEAMTDVLNLDKDSIEETLQSLKEIA